MILVQDCCTITRWQYIFLGLLVPLIIARGGDSTVVSTNSTGSTLTIHIGVGTICSWGPSVGWIGLWIVVGLLKESC